MRRTAAVRTAKALDNYLCVGKGKSQRVELTFYALIGLQNENALNPCVAKQVVNVPVKFLVPLEMPTQPSLQPVHRAARIDVSPCREDEDPQLTDPNAFWLIKPQVKLIDSLPHLFHRQAVLGS